VYRKDEKLIFYITLIGSACEYSNEIIDAMNFISNGKLGNTELIKSKCIYARQWSDAYAENIPPCGLVTIDFTSPVELLSSKKPIYEPDFSSFIESLFGRISSLCDNYGEKQFVLPYSLFAFKPQIIAEFDIKKVSINSNNHPINGFIGKIHYSGDITRYLPYIDLGSQIHIGKRTTRSCGEYIFEI
jgi:hypothetical protein